MSGDGTKVGAIRDWNRWVKEKLGLPARRPRKIAKQTPPEIEKSLQERFGITAEQMREQIKPLFMLMFDHGMTSITIDRTGTQCLVSVDGKQI